MARAGNVNDVSQVRREMFVRMDDGNGYAAALAEDLLRRHDGIGPAVGRFSGG